MQETEMVVVEEEEEEKARFSIRGQLRYSGRTTSFSPPSAPSSAAPFSGSTSENKLLVKSTQTTGRSGQQNTFISQRWRTVPPPKCANQGRSPTLPLFTSLFLSAVSSSYPWDLDIMWTDRNSHKMHSHQQPSCSHLNTSWSTEGALSTSHT
ncbi:hypothetical protein GN956_G8366 [Arapaima gigas]